jgi:hypothetical protein
MGWMGEIWHIWYEMDGVSTSRTDRIAFYLESVLGSLGRG